MAGPDSQVHPYSTLIRAAAVAVAIELVLLRTTTRALIHIPGLGRFEDPIGIVAEVGRYAYYMAVVLIIAFLVIFATTGLRSPSARPRVIGGVLTLYLGFWLLGLLDLASRYSIGWVSLGALLFIVVLTWDGRRSIPLALFVASSLAAGVSVLGQGDGGGLSGSTVDALVLASDTLLVLAAISSPLLVVGRIGIRPFLAGAVGTLIAAGAFAGGGSTLSIIVLWNLGVPGWLPDILYAVAFGGFLVTIWAALSRNRPVIAIGVLLLAAGGVGVISTYQTGLALAGLLLAAQRAPDPASPIEVDPIRAPEDLQLSKLGW